MESKKHWLPHLVHSIPVEAYGYPVTMYSIALEGWRRGLSLKFINKKKSNGKIRNKAGTEYVLTDNKNNKVHHFVGCRSKIITTKAVNICVNKNLAKEYLSKENVAVPNGKLFQKENTDEEIVDYANFIGYPLVLKPSNASGGKGVIANIMNEAQFKESLNHVKYRLKYSNLIVEEYFEGDDYRVFVIGEDVVGAVRRIPANVIGDGISTVRQLVKMKESERDKNPALFQRPIKIDNEMKNILSTIGYTISSVPNKGERVYLKSKNNISAGGDPIDATDELTEEVKKNAVKAVKAIPGLHQAGVDVLFDKEKKSGVIIEVNTQPSIRTHLFPMEGQARDVPKKIIDYYFPETKNKQINNQPLYYFDIKTVFDSFQSGIAKEIAIPDVPKGNLEITRFRLTGKLRDVNYERWIQVRALELNLNGYIKHLKNGETSVVVSGSKESIEQFRKIINNGSPRRARIESIVEKSRSRAVRIGFEIKNF